LAVVTCVRGLHSVRLGGVIRTTEVSRPHRCSSGGEGESRDRTGMSCPITEQHQPLIGHERDWLATGSAPAAAWSDRDRDAHPGPTGSMGANGSSNGNGNPPQDRERAGQREPGPFRASAGGHPQPRSGPRRSSESRPGYREPHPDRPGTHAESRPAAGDEPARVQGR
jgi:hypothetical protein